MTTSPINYTEYLDKVFAISGSDRVSSRSVVSYIIVPVQFQPTNISDSGNKQKLYNLESDFENFVYDADSELTVSIGDIKKNNVTTVVDGASPFAINWTTNGKLALKDTLSSANTLETIGNYYDTQQYYVVIAVWSRSVVDDNSDLVGLTNIWIAHKGDNEPDSEDLFIDRPSYVLNGPDYPVSSWHIKKLVIQSLNALMTRCLQAQSTPVFGLGIEYPE